MFRLFENGDISENRGTDSSPTIYAGGQHIGINELLYKGRAFAHLLRDVGCNEGDLFCTVMNKSIDFLISLLGINEAGGVVLPVDLDCTIDRFQAILFESSSRWMIADECAASLIGPGTLSQAGLNLGWMGKRKNIPDGITPEFIRDNINNYSLCANSVRVNPSSFSSLFWSGHKNGKLEAYLLRNCEIKEFIDKAINLISLDKDAHIAGFFPGHIIPFMFEIGVFLNHNASVCLFSPCLLKRGSTFLKTIRKQKATQVLCSSDDIRHLKHSHVKNSERCTSVRQIILWGDPPSRNRIGLLKAMFPNCSIHNFYMITGREEKEEKSQTHSGSDAPHAGYREETVYILSKEHFPDGIIDDTCLPTIKEVHHAHWNKMTLVPKLTNSAENSTTTKESEKDST